MNNLNSKIKNTYLRMKKGHSVQEYKPTEVFLKTFSFSILRDSSENTCNKIFRFFGYYRKGKKTYVMTYLVKLL